MDGLTILGERRWDLQMVLCGTVGMRRLLSMLKRRWVMILRGRRVIETKDLGVIRFRRYTGQVYESKIVEFEGKKAIFGGELV